MYQIPHEEFYKLYDASVNDIIDYFYSKEELIRFIAKWWYDAYWIDDLCNFHHEYRNDFILQCTCNIKNLVDKSFILYDNFNRIINVHDFEEDSLNFYHHELKIINRNYFNTINHYLWIKHNQYKKRHKLATYIYKSNYIYRQTPVPYTKKIRGGPSWHVPHTAKIFRMYANPEYKKFNRGSKKTVPNWWDDRKRIVQKNWKEQSKVRHQWEKNLNKKRKKIINEKNI